METVVRKATGFHASGFQLFTYENYNNCTFHCLLISVLCSLQCSAIQLQDWWRSPQPAACLCTLYELHWQHQCRDLTCISHSPEFILIRTETGCTHQQLPPLQVLQLIEFAGIPIAANATGTEIKTAALLREFLKKHPAAK